MTTIEKMADALMIANNAVYFDDSSDYQTALYQVCTALGMPEDDIGSEYIEKNQALESDKSLLEKTQEHHDHGRVAPSCVGCPTADVMLKNWPYTTVITERLEEAAFANCPEVDAVCSYMKPDMDDCRGCWKAYLTGEGE